MILCPKYSTFCWWQKFDIIILAEKPKSWILHCLYISTHTPCTMESVHQNSQRFCYLGGTVVNILVLKWNWYTFLFMLFLFLRQFWWPPAATRLLHFGGNAVINWLYSWIEQTFSYISPWRT
jgi:hypothetical protein